MPTSNSRLAFGDCYEILNMAMDDDQGARVKVPSLGDATHLRTRLHTARRIDREENAKTYEDKEHPMHGRSMYDKIVVRIKQLNGSVYLYLEKIASLTDDAEPLSEVLAIEPPKPMKLLNPPQEVQVQKLLTRRI